MITSDWQRAPVFGGGLEARSNPHGAVELHSTTTGERITALLPEWDAFGAMVKTGAFDRELS